MKRTKLLVADLHLTDNPMEEYRWGVFDHLHRVALEEKVDEIHLLGDTQDRKDRHSSKLVNRFVDEMVRLRDETGAKLVELLGNHNMLIDGGRPFFSFMRYLGVKFVTEPELYHDVWLLPFSPNPAEDWKQIPLNQAKAVFMHQTMAGSVVDGGRVIPSAPHPMPLLPRGLPIFSGDVHRPQQISGVTYVGVPHPTRFSETWRNRFLLIKDENYSAPKEIYLPSIKRAILDITSTSQLASLKFAEGDQVRVRYQLSAAKMTEWPIEEEAIRKWALGLKIVLASVEAVLTEDIQTVNTTKEIKSGEMEMLAPDQVIQLYAKDEAIDPVTTELGISLLKECQ